MIVPDPRISAPRGEIEFEVTRRVLRFLEFMQAKATKKFERFDVKKFNIFKYAPNAMTRNDVRMTSEICLVPTSGYFDSKLQHLYRKYEEVSTRRAQDQEWLRFYKLAHYFHVACWVDTGMKAANKTKVRNYLVAKQCFGLVDWNNTAASASLVKRIQNDVNLGFKVFPAF